MGIYTQPTDYVKQKELRPHLDLMTDTSAWKHKIAITGVFKRYYVSNQLAYLDIPLSDYQSVLSSLVHQINKAIYKQGYTHRKKRCWFVAFWEYDEQVGHHFNAVLDKPDFISSVDFDILVRRIWSEFSITKTIFIKDNADEEWTKYIMKNRSKENGSLIDALDLDTFYNPCVSTFG